MVTNFNISAKTKVPACCNFSCCGNKFGRITRRPHKNHGINRIKRSRRYAKHVERRIVRAEILMEMEYNND